jgi:hypothetical protein
MFFVLHIKWRKIVSGDRTNNKYEYNLRNVFEGSTSENNGQAQITQPAIEQIINMNKIRGMRLTLQIH